ncbi:BON domain-containing protein [Chthonobacter rhizosphaerae]|uniref:BON domain-containing protein n=1 Tax=Chthonobacter rhizosphaerae TaxID=2735553 RepID=UPI0015EFB8FC|nr:BON domain-containing protein [Chthonobacter rhizosphaerae]
MADRKKAFLAAAAVALVIALPAALLAPRGVESSIERIVADASNLEITGWATVTVDGRTVRLSGVAPDEAHLNLTVALFQALPSVGSVDSSAATVLPTISPYGFVVERDGDTLTLSGHVPSEAVRGAILEAAAALSSVTVTDALEIGGGAPKTGFEDATRALVRVMGLMTAGRASLTDQAADIAGVAASSSGYQTLSSAGLLLPAGYTVGSAVIERPVQSPFVFDAKREGDALVLTGFVPSIAAEERVMGAARAAAGIGLRVVNHLAVAGGAPDGFADVAATAVAALARFEAGTVRLSDTAVTVDGTALTPSDARQLAAFIDAFKPVGYEVEALVTDPVVRPFVLTIARTADAMSVSGFLPRATEQAALRKALAPDPKAVKVLVETSAASGAPEGFADALSFAAAAARTIDSGSVAIEDEAILIRGTTPTSGRFADLGRLLGRQPAGFTVRAEVAPPMVPAWAWSLERTGKTLTVAGFVPSEPARAAVVDVVSHAIPEATVQDRMELASGMPDGFDPVDFAGFAARQLAVLDSGLVSLDREQALVKGTTASADAAALVRSAFAADLPPGLVGGAVDISSPPQTRLVVTSRPGGVEMTGTVPSSAAKQAAATAADLAFGSLPVTDRLRVTSGLDSASAGLAELAVLAASRLENGLVTVVDRRIRVSGSTFHPTATAALRSFLESRLPAGYVLDADFGYRLAQATVTPEVCQAMAADTLANFPIRFTEGGALDPAGAGGIDRLISIAFRCPQASIAVLPASAGDRQVEAARAASLQGVLVAAGITEGRVRVGSPRPSTTASAELVLTFGG